MNNGIVTQEHIEYKFSQFDLMCEQSKLDMILSEAIGIKSNYSINEMQLIHEGVIDKIKAAFNALIENIKKLWAKFKESISYNFSSNIEYLKKNKDIIITKPLKEDAYIMRPFWKGTDAIFKEAVPAWNLNSLKDNLVDDDSFLKNTAPFNKYYTSEKDDFVENTKSSFRGGPKDIEIKSSDIPMSKIYDFCVDYENVIKKLNTDIDQIDKVKTEVIKMIQKLEVETREKEGSAPSTEKIDSGKIKDAEVKEEDKKDENKSANESYNLFDRSSMIYSFLTESYIIYEVEEDKTSKPGTPVKKSVADGKKENVKSPSNNMNNIDKNDENYNKEDDVKNSVDDINADIDKAKRYAKLSYQFLNAKMTVVEEAYKAYMFIIRDHVKSYVGSKKSDNGGSVAKGTSKKETDEIDKLTSEGQKALDNKSSKTELFKIWNNIQEKIKTNDDFIQFLDSDKGKKTKEVLTKIKAKIDK